MALKNLVLKNRSCRRFYGHKKIGLSTLSELVDMARLTPSSANLQPLKYIISNDPAVNAKIFTTLAWAGYLKNWEGPLESERPGAYIIILGDNKIKDNINCDHGIAAQTILLGAAEKDLAGCIIQSVKRSELRQALNIADHLNILLVIALGFPKEKIVLEIADTKGSIEYWRDADIVHHVPKRKLKDILIKTFTVEKE